MTDAEDLREDGEIEPAGPGAAQHDSGSEPEAAPEAVDGESIAVPAGDLTGSITGALDELTGDDSR
jgi:hypothetical protein